MKIAITDNRKIQHLQEEFTSSFPYLRIEFFSRSHKPGTGTSPRSMRAPERTIGECRKIHRKGHLSINENMTVAELEQSFRELYGLNVQVFRKSGKVWLETTVTDGWTLAEQNSQGEALSNLVLMRTNGPAEDVN